MAYSSRLTSEDGLPRVDFDVGLHFLVNGKSGRKWALVIAYEPNDLYSVWLVEGHEGRRAESMVLACHRDVFCDMLQAVIESIFDRAIAEHNNVFIPLSSPWLRANHEWGMANWAVPLRRSWGNPIRHSWFAIRPAENP